MKPRLMFGITVALWGLITAIWASVYVIAAIAAPNPAANYETRWSFQLASFLFRYGPVLLLALCAALASEYIMVARASAPRMGKSARLVLCAALLGGAGAASYLYSLRILSASLFQCIQAGHTDGFACHESGFYRWVGISLAFVSVLGLLIAAGLRLRRGRGYAGTGT